MRLQIPELCGGMIESSNHRHQCMNCFPEPKLRQDVINMLGDQSDKEQPIFREMGDDDFVKTVTVGKLCEVSW